MTTSDGKYSKEGVGVGEGEKVGVGVGDKVGVVWKVGAGVGVG
jgi:hypothetical protein